MAVLPQHISRALSDAVRDLDAAWTEAFKFLGGSINTLPTSDVGEPSEINVGVDATDNHLRKVLTFGYHGKFGSKLKQAVDQFVIKKKVTLPTELKGNCLDNEIQQLQFLDKNEAALPNHLHELPTTGAVETTYEVQPHLKSVYMANDVTIEVTYGVQHPDISTGDAQDGTSKTTHQDLLQDQVPLPQQFDGVVSSDEHDMVPDEVRLFKKAVLSFHNIVNNDFLAKDPIGDKHCVKCGGGGPSLVCSDSSCRLAIHESCLVSPCSFEDDDNFYCPFCSYAQARATFEKAMEKYFMAQKAWITFIMRYLLCQKKQKQAIVEASSKFDEERNMGNTSCSLNCNESRILGGVLETPPSTQKDACDEQKDGHGLNNFDAQGHCMQNIKEVDTLEMQNKQKKAIPEVSSEPVEEKNMGNTECSLNCNGGSTFSGVVEKSPNNENDANDRQMYIRGLNVSYEQGPCLQHVDEIGVIGMRNGETLPSKKHTKHRKPAKRYATLVDPYARRTSLPWTNEEKDILMELVNRHQKSNRQYVSWTKILEAGGGKFHKTWTPVDLKDKWRNILKKCSREEKSAN